MGLFIQFVSKNYIKSRMCLNEEGSAWVLIHNLYFIPIVLSGSTDEDISWFWGKNKGIHIENRSSILNLYQNRKDFFDRIGKVDITVLSEKVDEFIAFLIDNNSI